METSKQNGTHWLITGALLAAMGVGLGAFGAHGLEQWIAGNVEDVSKNIEYWNTANRYLMYHALALLVVGLSMNHFGRSVTFNVAGVLFVIGIALFSGCLYAMAVTDAKVLGAIVPIGGLLMIVGWLTYVIGLRFSKPRNGTNVS